MEDGRTWDGERELLPNPVWEDGSEVQVLRSTSSYGWSDIATLLRLVVSSARRSLAIVQGYFVPDPRMTELICDTARRGVDVTVVTPGEHIDARVTRAAGDDAVEALLRAGVRVHRYCPTMMHTKIVLVDDVLAVVGSANFNQRSMRWDDEVCLVVLDADVVETLRRDLREDLGRSREVTLEKWRRRPWWQRVHEFLSWFVRRYV
ncbi:MAG: phospholipase D-like domain-containing protein [Myxococcota bacterium]